MPIQEDNIVFVESQVMDDVPEGGGAATGNVIIDGQMNNVFEDISDLDRAYGRFNLRKLFLAVRAVNTDLYGGAKSVITQLPEDEAVGYTLFSTDDQFDTRASAANKVEAYLYKGPMWHGALHENHITGMRAISVIQNVDTALPPIGKTLCLVQDENEPGEVEQYVRVTDVEAIETEFEDQYGTFTRWIVRMDISDALRFDFKGHTVNRYNSYNYTDKTRLRDTTVADATLYFGSQKLAEPAAIGDLTVKAASMYTQLVPSAQTETPLTSQMLASELAPMVSGAPGTITYTETGFNPRDVSFATRTGVLPGTLAITWSGNVITDDGKGSLYYSGTKCGTIDYASGECVTDSNAPSALTTWTFSYRPAAACAQQSHQKAFQVTVENRRLNWLTTLSPVPAPGTLSVAFMAQGNWYQLDDDGTGQIKGEDASNGAGTISFVTGDLAVTLGALPDAGSQIMITYASTVHYTSRGGDVETDPRITMTQTVGEAVNPGTFELSWLSDAITRSVTAGNDGVFTGDAEGWVDYATGDFTITFNSDRIPDPGTQLGVDYERNGEQTKVFSGVASPGGLATVDVGEGIRQGSVKVEWSTDSIVKFDASDRRISYYGGSAQVAHAARRNTQAGESRVRRDTHEAHDTGNGALSALPGSVVDYVLGQIVVPVLPDVPARSWESSGESSRWVEHTLGSEVYQFSSGIITVTYTPSGAPTEVVSTTLPLPDLKVRILPRLIDEFVVPGSVYMTWNGQHYTDRSGTMYRSIDVDTGAGVEAGTIDYLTGEVTLTNYVTGTGSVVVQSVLTRFGDWLAVDGYFRTQMAPIKPEALSVVAVAADGEQLSGIADADGNITGDSIAGTVDYEFGTAQIQFGSDPGGGWVERQVDPATIRYSAVAYSYLPLDAGILGIDPVRLPADGRVPIFRPGGLVMVMHRQDYAASAIANGGTIDVGRTRLAWVRVLDANGDAVSGDLYELDRVNGTLTFPDVTGIAQPMTVRHTVGDLRMITDAQISGQLSLSRALTHDYPANESIVAGCLIHGDRRARVSATWDQSSWNGTWVDYLVGSPATGTLNLIDFPIEVTNEGCDTDRWVLRWTSSTTAELISEKRGLVWSGTYTAGGQDIAPINPRTRTQLENGTFVGGEPYMVIPGAANGGGWSTGNVVRINTIGAIADMWLARAIKQSEAPLDDGTDCVEMYALGNIDRP